MIQRITLIAGAVLGFLSVALGAFGAHALKPHLVQAGRLDTFELAVEYQFYHAFALLITGILGHIWPSDKFKYAAICFILGVGFFSGSLYALSFAGLGLFGLLTPIGGVLLILGWSFLAVGLLQNKKAP